MHNLDNKNFVIQLHFFLNAINQISVRVFTFNT